MTPEFSKRAGAAISSPYWTPDDDEEFLRRREDFYKLQDALYEAESYDDLSKDIKELFDRAETAEVEAARKWEEFVAQDTDGYGRFLQEGSDGDLGTLVDESNDRTSEDNVSKFVDEDTSHISFIPTGKAMSTDKLGYKHKGEGPGGGQFTSSGSADSTNRSVSSKNKLPHQLDGEGNVPNPEIADGARPVLEKQEAQALSSYTGSEGIPLNKWLRGESPSSGENRIIRGAIDSALGKAKLLDKPIRVFRGMSVESSKATEFIAKCRYAQTTGDDVLMRGYVSASTDINQIQHFSSKPGRTKVTISITASKGLDLSPYTTHTLEKEFLMAHESRFRVKTVTGDPEHGYSIEMEQIV